MLYVVIFDNYLFDILVGKIVIFLVLYVDDGDFLFNVMVV